MNPTPPWDPAALPAPPPPPCLPPQPLANANNNTRNPQDPKPRPPTLSNLQSFTFIDHDDDLASKRIKDAAARKAIRSHVMRDVRRRERLAGLKRTSKHDRKRPKQEPKPDPDNKTQSPNIKNEPAAEEESKNGLLLKSPSESVASSSELSLLPRSKSSSMTSYSYADDRYSNSPPSPLRNGTPGLEFDPFMTLPGADADTISEVLIPMTFPSEFKQPLESKTRMAAIINSTISEPGPFFGYMSLSAAHRAITQGDAGIGKNGQIVEPGYYAMKARCIEEMNNKMRDPELSLADSAFDIVVSLISGALAIGDFDEARVHVQGLRKMIAARGGITSPSFQGEGARILNNVLTCDITTACGMMSRPYFPLTWDPQPIPPELSAKIFPPPNSPLLATGIPLITNPSLSPTLRNALSSLREILFFEYASTTTPTNFTPTDHEIFVFKSHEVEHELLDYPYRFTPSPPTTTPTQTTPPTLDDPPLTPLESIARIAAILHICFTFVVSPPSSGIGRALVHHITSALKKYPSHTLPLLPPSHLDLIAWATFLGARGARGQPTRAWFLERLREVGRLRGWEEGGWEEVERVMGGYLFMPGLDRGVFRGVWEEVVEGPVVEEL
ncbi:hypothetical protein FQN50_002905 [Emmonsiellopsis sp. PD_5]|nr:hypothetical protein FQN50_002905 [Emmonsiellopsis sp. PD_5]